MPRFNKRGSFGEEESMTTPVTPFPHSRSSGVITWSRGLDDVNHVTQNIGTPTKDLTDKTTLEEYEHSDNVSVDDLPNTFGSGRGRRSSEHVSSNALHPGTILDKHNPSLKRLEDLPGISVVTWEEFLKDPSTLCGLFEVDREEFIHYNPEQVNVFFHDSRMEQPTLGAPSGDGLSWTIFIDNYNHLKSVRTWLTERVSVILLQLVTSKGHGSAACLVAINPARKQVGSRLQDSFSRAVDALQQRNFCIEIDLNGCVQSWCRTDLQMACKVKGGRVVITNAEERIPCSRVDNVPFCLACFPVWGLSKLSYKYKRQSEYEDIFLAFSAEDLSFGNTPHTLNQSTEKNNNINSNAKSKPSSTKSSGSEKSQQVWMKKNKQGADTPTHTPGTADKADIRASLEIEEVDSGESRQERRRPKRYNSKRDKERGQDSGFSSDNTSTTERCEPQLSKGIPDYRPHGHVPPRPSDKAKKISRNQRTLDDASSTSASTSYASSVLSHGFIDGAPTRSAASISWQVVQDVEEEIRDSDFMNLPSNSSSQDYRAEFARTFSVVEPDDEEGGYMLMEESPTTSPRPDTPYHKSLTSTSMKGKRPVMMSQGAVIKEERLEHAGKMSSGNGLQASRSTPPSGNVPEQRSSLRFHVNQSTQEQDLYGIHNEAFEYEDSHSEPSKLKQSPANKVLNDEKNRGSKAFPYTSEYLDDIGGVANHTPSYGLVDQDAARGDDLKKKKTASAVRPEPADLMFVPRDNSQHKHNTHTTVDDVEDVEDEINVLSDDDMTSPQGRSAKLKNHGVIWEADYDQDQDGEGTGAPIILPGAKGAQQLRSSKEFPAQTAGGEMWRRGGQQNDSRRRYIALNSLRRKSNQQALQADLRKQKQSEISLDPYELVEL
ncbi:hypothetical protein ACOMHN_033259 [Nucella lapillus]